MQHGIQFDQDRPVLTRQIKDSSRSKLLMAIVNYSGGLIKTEQSAGLLVVIAIVAMAIFAIVNLGRTFGTKLTPPPPTPYQLSNP